MLKTRSRAATVGKQAVMPDTQSLPPSPNGSNKPRVSSTFLSPRLFNGFSPKGFSDSEAASASAAMSPTSILENKPLSSIGNLLFSEKHPKKPPFENGVPKAIGLAIVDALSDEEDKDKSSNPQRRMVLFGSKLKIQVPYIHPNSSSSINSTEFSNSPIEFGIKNRETKLALFSPGRRSLHKEMAAAAASSPRVIVGSLSASEMELSEDYTCVITHGPNPRTTHIFDDCVVESSGNGFIVAATARKENNSFVPNSESYPFKDFLSFCDACKKDLGQGKETFMYRDEKAFCSNECRHAAMLFDEGSEKRLAESSPAS